MEIQKKTYITSLLYVVVALDKTLERMEFLKIVIHEENTVKQL